MVKYLTKSFKGIDWPPEGSATEWLNANPNIVVISILPNISNIYGCTVIYINPEYDGGKCDHEYRYASTTGGNYWICRICSKRVEAK